MKYALLNGEKIEAQTGIKDAVCPVCGELMVPHCGPKRIHHWKHKSKHNCDPWWENETEWHRQWKDNFPKECQEVIHYDETTGEKHVADVKTKTGIILEFQHSPMGEEEQYSREKFYKNMIWVVDARKYYNKFIENIKHLSHIEKYKAYFYVEEKYKCFPEKWLFSTVPVIFDFGIDDKTENNDNKQKKWLWCVFPTKYTENLGYNSGGTICGLCLKKDTFINRVSDYDKFFSNIVISELEELKRQNIYKEKCQQEEKRDQEKKLKEQLKFKIEEEKREQEKKLREELKQQNIYKEKCQQEEKIWINAILYVKSKIRDHKAKIKKLNVSKKGIIHDNDNRVYNNKKCVILGVKSYPAESNGIEYTKSNILLLVQDEDSMIVTTTDMPSSTINGSWLDYNDKVNGDYNCYIRTLDVMWNYKKYSFCFGPNKYKINVTEKLKNDLEYIKEGFSKYKI